MIINRGNLEIAFTAFNTAFRGGVAARQAMSQWASVASLISSSTSQEKYGWLGALPNLREWVGERHVHGLEQHDYTIRNKDFELTIGVDRNDIEDDQFAIYSERFSHMGRSVAGHPDLLVWPLLKKGFGSLCYDGQYFFDTDHPVIQEDGSMGTASNDGGGNGTAWFLMDDSMGLKPLIFQQRKNADNLVSRVDDTDENVFSRREFEYGVHCRDNVGFAWWQVIYGSKQALTAAHYETARVALMGMKGDHGRPLGLTPKKLIVPPALEKEALEIVNAERNAQGATNVYRGTAELSVVPWLA